MMRKSSGKLETALRRKCDNYLDKRRLGVTSVSLDGGAADKHAKSVNENFGKINSKIIIMALHFKSKNLCYCFY